MCLWVWGLWGFKHINRICARALVGARQGRAGHGPSGEVQEGLCPACPGRSCPACLGLYALIPWSLCWSQLGALWQHAYEVSHPSGGKADLASQIQPYCQALVSDQVSFYQPFLQMLAIFSSSVLSLSPALLCCKLYFPSFKALVLCLASY